ncbi:MAG TPA: hypothetical protein VIY86_02685, partial [Pirellulaceae bacterium]
IGVFGDGRNWIYGNRIGTNVAGDEVYPTNEQMTFGVILFGGSGNIVGTNGDGHNDAAEGNIISGQISSGVLLQVGTSNNVIAGNRIGTTADGNTALGNGRFGVFFLGAGTGNRVGTDSNDTSDVDEANVLSGNLEGGVFIDSSANLVAGNWIGTNIGGTVPLGNGIGVNIQGGSQNLIGGSTLSAGNVIAFNTIGGVLVSGGTENAVLGNSVFDNTGLGLNLADANDPISGVTPNDAGDGDAGSNNLQNYGVLSSATLDSGVTTVTGTLDSTPNATHSLEFFDNSDCDVTGHGEGRTPLGRYTVLTDANGHVDFQVPLFGSLAIGQFVTSTVTDSQGSTSEFSACVAVTGDNAIRWIATESGSWSNPANWENGQIPGPMDHAVIDVLAADITVTVPAGSFAVASLISREALVVDDSTLELGADSEITALQITGGGTIRILTGILSVGQGSSDG